MPVVEESRSESSLYDFFDESKNRKRVKASKDKNTDTTEEKASITDTEKKSKDDDNSKMEGNINEGELISEVTTAVQLSESDNVLIENVSEQEKSAIRSKTSDETTENASTERYVKSDTAFASELVLEYPDIEGAGDGSYSIISNDDEGVQIDIHIDTGMSEFSDRATAVTIDSQANNYVNDAISENENEATLSDIAEDRGQSVVSDEDGEYVSDNEYERDKETSIEVEVYCDSDTSQSNDSSATESEDEHADDISESEEDGLRDDDSSEEERDSASLNDNSERGSVASYCRCDSDKEDENSPLVSDDDSDQGSQDRSSPQYDPCSDEDNGVSDDENPETSPQFNDFEDVSGPKHCNEDQDADDESQWSDRESDAISGTRESFTPYEDCLIDEPNEGNRPESSNDVYNNMNRLETSLNKSDGDTNMRVDLSRSYIKQHKDTCIAEGAQTLGELIVALHRKRLIELAEQRKEHGSEKDVIEVVSKMSEELPTEGHETEHTNIDRHGTQNDDFTAKTVANCENTILEDKPKRKRLEIVDVERNCNKDDVKLDRNTVSKKNRVIKNDTKATKAKNGAHFGKQKSAQNPIPSSVFNNNKAHSAVLPRTTGQYTQGNLRQGSKPVLPAIFKAPFRPAGPGQTSPGKDFATGKKPVLRHISVATPPIAFENICSRSPRNAPIPLVPIQLRSNACFRNGQLEVEVACDERMYSVADPMNVKVTFVHKHVPLSPNKTKASAYQQRRGKKWNKALTWLSSPANRNIIHQRAQWPPFDTHLDQDASARHKKIFGHL